MGTHYISGDWQSGHGAQFESTNPATNELLWQGQEADSAQVTQAVQAARTALPNWRKTAYQDKLNYLKKYAEILTAAKPQLTKLISEETGKPLWEAATEAGAMIGKIALSEQAYQERTGEKVTEQAGATIATRHRGHGVLAVFGPYNFPGHLPNGHIVPALLAGNTIVYKPSEQTPRVAEFMVQCLVQSGLPAGVVNLVQGGRVAGEFLAQANDLDGVLFTGSHRVGQLLHQQFAGQTGKLLALEMGGNNPLIVYDVEDLDAAVIHTIQSAFITAGQRCTCARRLIVQESIAAAFLSKLVDTVRSKLKVGLPGDAEEPFMGTVINRQVALDLVRTQQALLDAGGESLLALEHLDTECALVSPGIVDVTAIKNLHDEEIFGPLLQVIRVKDFDEALAVANDTAYGLSAGLLSDKTELFNVFYGETRAGIVNWNRPITGASGAAPFGGTGNSGNLRPSAFYAADYCAYPIASIEASECVLPASLPVGLTI